MASGLEHLEEKSEVLTEGGQINMRTIYRRVEEEEILWREEIEKPIRFVVQTAPFPSRH